MKGAQSIRMRETSTKKVIIFVLWIVLAVWVISRNPTGSTAREKLDVAIKDLDYLLNN